METPSTMMRGRYVVHALQKWADVLTLALAGLAQRRCGAGGALT
jgi:hypothetical protein